MTENRNNGGPAFPQISELGDIAATSAGMSLRDWFAGQFLAGRMARGSDYRTWADAAADAYEAADAMLATRSSSKEA